MKKISAFILIFFFSTSFFASIFTVKQVTATGNVFDANGVFDLRTNLPRTTNGENGITLQYLAVGTYYNLPYYQDYVFGIMEVTDPNRWLIPQVSGYLDGTSELSTDTVLVHPSAIYQCGREADTIIRVTIPGDGGEVRVTGSVGTNMGGTVLFYIYKGENQYNNPIWSASGGGFDFSIQYQAGDQIFFAADAGADDVNDHGNWFNVKLSQPQNQPETLTPENVRTWIWNDHTDIFSVAKGDVDGDGQVEIVTGGKYRDGREVAQLCVWNGSNLALENTRTWYWTGDTSISSVALGNVDGDSAIEIVTGGYYYDGTRYVAQLCVWNGATLFLENVKTWYWTGDTFINSVALGDVEGDGQAEIVTGGHYYDGTREVAQLCVWNGATLALENIRTWYWTSYTYISSVALGNVDEDGQVEIVTGGYYHDGTRYVAQLCVWTSANLALENVRTWDWISNTYPSDTYLNSVAVGNVDGDSAMEIVTGGQYGDGTRHVAQLCVWNGATLALENMKTWYWSSNTNIVSVALGNFDADGQVEIVTGGDYYDRERHIAQLCVWNGENLALENLRTWYWTGHTYISSVALGNVDGDAQVEIVTGGYYHDGTRYVAQLCVWAP